MANSHSAQKLTLESTLKIMGNKNLTLLGENRGVSLWPQGMKGFLKQFTKSTNKGGERWIDLTTLKFKHLRASKDTINKVKREVTGQEREFAMHITKKCDFQPEYVKRPTYQLDSAKDPTEKIVKIQEDPFTEEKT